ncbi:YceI family protein [Pelagibacterium lacus]|nr:YceI family protein [Pelagibacterium lacus]
MTEIQAASWTMIPEASTLSFAGTQTGSEFRGQFRRFETGIVLDPADLSSATIEVLVDIASFASGSPDRDSDSQNRSWFYTANFPQAVFTSSAVVEASDGSYVALGTLEIKGVTREVELPFTLAIDGDSAVADGTLSLNRLDYEIGNMDEDVEEELVGHGVTVSFHVEAVRAE